MARRYYPAVLERDEDNGVFAVWFPDFPGCVAAAPEQEAAIAKAHDALTTAVQAAAERAGAPPDPTAMEAVKIPRGVRPLSLFSIGVMPPNPSERINVYLPKALIERLDHRANELGMSRSSFIGFAVSRILDTGAAIWLPTVAKFGEPPAKPKKRAGGT